MFSVCAKWGLCFDQWSEPWLATIPTALPTATPPTALTITQNEVELTFTWTAGANAASALGYAICMPSTGGYEYDDGSGTPTTIAVDCTNYMNVFLGNSGYVLPADASRSMTYINNALGVINDTPWLASAFDAYNATDLTTRNWDDDATATSTGFVVCEIYYSLLTCSTPATDFDIAEPPTPAAPEPVTAEIYNDIVILVDWADPRADPVDAPTEPCTITGYTVEFWDQSDSDDNQHAWL